MNIKRKSATFTAAFAVSVLTLPMTNTQAESIQMLSDVAQRQVELGIQTVPKGTNRRSLLKGPNPFLAQVIDSTKVNFYGWRKEVESQARAAQKKRNAVQPRAQDLQPMLVDELEPANLSGLNDTLAASEFILGFGTGLNPKARILGTLAPPGGVSTNFLTASEDDGAISLANPSGVGSGFGAMQASGNIGDGPHGSTGSGSGDFDFYSVDLSVGQKMTVDTDVFGGFDSVLVVYDATGAVVAANDDDGEIFASKLTYAPTEAGTFYVMVSGFGGAIFPNDPFDSASGAGIGSEGDYGLLITTATPDVDIYGINLKAGDVIGATINGAGNRLQVFENGGFEVFGSSQDLSALYPVSSPLPGGGNAVLAYTAAVTARHYVAISGNEGNYDATFEVYRAGLENEASGSVQTILLDFDGARVQTSVFGGRGQRELTGLAGFLGGWGLGSDDEDALIDAIVGVVNENLKEDMIERGFNKNFNVEIVDSRDATVTFGDDHVSRVVIGGTIQESGIFTLGIASSIDPGNFGHEDDALVLLDLLSAPIPDPNSINTYLAENVENRIDLIAEAIGNIVAHEVGHFLGNYHTDQFNDQASLMDQGGNLPNAIGAGLDQVLGTGDDVDVDFRLDDFVQNEGITGDEDVLNNTAFGLTTAD
ncbi:MAG: PPC domain-containing protein [Methylococcales bacterium]